MFITRPLLTIVLTSIFFGGACCFSEAQISGFNSGTGWTLNSANATGYNSNTALGIGTSSLPSLTASTAKLLPNRSFSGAASSIFYNTAQAVAAFQASFTYTAAGGSSIGDGVAFVIQGSSLNAIGRQGGNGSTTIALSFATAFNFNAATPGNDFIIDGVNPIYSSTGALSLANNQDPIEVTLTYNTITLYETITDTVTGVSYSTSRNVDLNAIVGGQIGQTGQSPATTAYIGFTAGSSANVAGVTISNFTFTPVTVPGIQFIPKPIVPNGWGSCVAPNGYGGDYYQQTGVYGDYFFSPSQQAQFQQSGMTLIRADLTWDNVEFSKGVYNWSYYDGLVNNLAGSRVNVMFILDYSNALYPGNLYQQPALSGFANFAAAAAVHFQGKNVFYEIYNEPNFRGFSGAQYSTVAIATEQAMRTAYPNVTIIGPAEGELDPIWRPAMLSTGGGGSLNAYSFHPYYSPPEGALVSGGYQDGFPGVAADLVAFPASNGLPLPMMASESGNAGDTLQNQASWYTRIYLTDQLFGLALNTAYKYQDGQPTDNSPANNDYGMIYANNTAKPAYTAVKNLIASLLGYEQIGSINTGNSNVYDSVYQKGTSLAEAIWSTNSFGDAALPYIHYVTTGSGEYTQILNAVYANSSAVIAPPSYTTQFTVTAPAVSVTGAPLTTPFQVTVKALDEYNNVSTSYNGTVHFTSTDAAAVLPADTQLSNGVATVKVAFNTAGYQYVTATDTTISSITNAYLGDPQTAFNLASSITPIVVNQGTSFASTITVVLGNNSSMTLSLAGLPSGVTGSLSSTSFNSDGTCTLTLNTSLTAPLGSYSIQINSVSGSVQSTTTIPLTVAPGTGLSTGSYLATGQYVVSPSGNCFLIQQSNGSLVLYNGSGPSNQGSLLWSSQATGSGGSFYTVMQTDGNLVTYSGSGPSGASSFVWQSATATGSNYTLAVLNTKVLEILNGTTVISTLGTPLAYTEPPFTGLVGIQFLNQLGAAYIGAGPLGGSFVQDAESDSGNYSHGTIYTTPLSLGNGVSVSVSGTGQTYVGTQPVSGPAANLYSSWLCTAGSGSSNVVTISGLIPGKSYTLVGYGGVSGNLNCSALFTGALTGDLTGSSSAAFFLGTTYVKNNNAIANSAGQLTFTVTADTGTNNYYSALSGFTLKANTGTSSAYGAWATQYFGSATTLGAAETDTPLEDGVSNLEKYLCDINPTFSMSVADRKALPTLSTMTIGNTNYLTLTFRQNPASTQATVTVESSSTLASGSWTTPTGASIVLLSGTVTGDSSSSDQMMRAQVPITNPAHQFIRLNLTGP